MLSPSQLTVFLRLHSTLSEIGKLPRPLRDVLAETDTQTGAMLFHVADARRHNYFELIDTTGARHSGSIVHVSTRAKATILFSSRGGAGDIWESFLLPFPKIEYVALRSKQGRI